MKIHCPECQTAFERDILRGDERIECPHCKRSFGVNSKDTVLYLSTAAGEPDEKEAGRPRSSAHLAAGERLGGFTIERLIGEGGMGVVYLATQLSLGKKVAIKVLPPALSGNPEFIRRFDREAQALAALNHPNIVTIIDKGYSRGFYYFVMEFVEGITLRQLLREKRLTSAEALRIVPEICSALEYAHGRGIVHRDIKPENILITADGRLKIADFGLSKIVQGEGPPQHITRTHTTVGTFEYMAPEQRESSRSVDPRADLYSLGVIFYEMLTGELPIGRFPPPSTKNRSIGPELDDVVMRVLDKDPDRRFQRASEVASEIVRASQPRIPVLSPILDDPPAHPLVALGRKALDRARAFAIRHKGMLIVTFVLLCFAPQALGPWLFVFGLVLFVQYTKKGSSESRVTPPPVPTPPPLPILTPAPDCPPPPRTSLLCWGACLAGLALFSTWFVLHAVYGVEAIDRYRDLSMPRMAETLVGVASTGVAGLLGILLGLSASARARRKGKKGRWLARLGTLASLVFLIQVTSFWGRLHDEYRYWRGIEDRLEKGEGVDELAGEILNFPDDHRVDRRIRVLVQYEPSYARHRLLPEASPYVQGRILRELARTGDPIYLPDIEKMMLPPADHRARESAIESLAHYPPSTVVDVLSRYRAGVAPYRAKGSPYPVRKDIQAAIRILARIDDPAAIEILSTWVDDPDPQISDDAAEAILGSPAARESAVALANVLSHARTGDLRRRAARRLADFPGGAGALALVGGLADPDEDVRRACYAALESRFETGYRYDPTFSGDHSTNREAVASFRELAGSLER